MVAGICALFGLSQHALSQEHQVEVYLFWEQGCPHCEQQIRSLASIEARDATVRVHYLELGRSENRDLYAQTARALGMREVAVPLTVVGGTAILGATSELDLGPTADDLIAECRRTACVDVLAPVARDLAAVDDRALAMREVGPALDETRPSGPGERQAKRFTLPFVGEVDLRSLSLPALTIVLAAVDGFNPCAMWVLVFLIGLLLGMQDRARRWMLGAAFLLTTAVVYYLVIAAWLGTLRVIGVIPWLRIAIGLLALAGGGYYVWGYVRNPEAICRVAGESRRQRIMTRLRTASAEPRFMVALAAIVLLAVGVNFIELLCSAGIPAVYTQILALTPMPAWQYYAWLGLYVAVFLLDDLAVFVVAMVTLEVTGGGARYAHYAQLVGGVVLLIVGVLLIFRPEWLSFG